MRLDTEKGFTLLEILIASSMFAVLLTVLFGTYSASLRVMDRAGADVETYNMARVALDRISEDLEASFLQDPSPEPGISFDRVFGAFEGFDRAVGEYDGDFLRFLSRARVALDGSGGWPVESEITYDAREQETGGALSLFRIDTPFGTRSPDRGIGGHMLCTGLTGVKFSYHLRDVELDRWDSTAGETSGKIPDRVSVKLTFLDSASPEMRLVFTTEVAIPSARGQNDRTAP